MNVCCVFKPKAVSSGWISFLQSVHSSPNVC